MTLVAIAMFLVLQAVALVHVGWALGMRWPAKSRAALSATVIGVPEGTPMPPAWLTLGVAVGISLLGCVALWGGGVVSISVISGYRSWGLIGVAMIFGVRGIFTYLPFGALQASVEPFRSLDRRYFAPLCLALALGYLVIFTGL